ncbi:methyl-accepting chemotaxis protein [Neptuniibacter sp. QD72_48]|uniref:methyl-accepting chemotaxis protein n=1 Tax=unclassified Neptuniibacter TaxID=2630693 RepID=UPI0039F743A4
MFRSLTIRKKILMSLLLMGLVPLLIAISVAIIDSSDALERSVYQQLTGIREIKKSQIENYFAEREIDLNQLAEIVRLRQASQLDSLEPYHVSASSDKAYANFQKQGGYYDLFLINPQGDIFYTVEREPDFGTNLMNGTYADSNLARLFKQVLGSGKFGIIDFAPYAPSNGAAAAFIALPIKNAEDSIELVVALQLSITDINAIMGERNGLGETGETYLVGPDHLMRSDSFLDPIHHTVLASFANPEKGKVDTQAANDALAQKTGTNIIIDYNGNPVLSSYTPVTIKGLQWALLAEVDEAEAFAPIYDLQWLLGSLLISSLIIIVLVALKLAGSLANPISRISQHMKEIASGSGDLTVELEVKGSDEIALLSSRFNTFVNKIRETVSDVAESTKVMAEATEQLSQNVDTTQVSINQQQQDTSQAAAAINQMTSAVQQVACSTSEALAATHQAQNDVETGLRVTEQTIDVINALASEVEQATQVIQRLNKQSDSVTTVLEVIRDIADQTNLLALNAAIEAARAGDSGRGFSVVADEVRNLAQRTQASTEEIDTIITDLQGYARSSMDVMNKGKVIAASGVEQVAETGAALERIITSVNHLTEMNTQIATASEQQAHVSEEINRSILSIDQIAQVNADGASQTQESNLRLSELSSRLKRLVGEFKLT